MNVQKLYWVQLDRSTMILGIGSTGLWNGIKIFIFYIV